MKKFISVLLILLTVLSILTPALAATSYEYYVDSTAITSLSNIPYEYEGNSITLTTYKRTKSRVFVYDEDALLYVEAVDIEKKDVTVPTPAIVYNGSNILSDKTAQPGDKCAIEILSTTSSINKKDLQKLKPFFISNKGEFNEDLQLEMIKIRDYEGNTDFIYAITFALPDPIGTVEYFGDIVLAKTISAAKNTLPLYQLTLNTTYNMLDVKKKDTVINIPYADPLGNNDRKKYYVIQYFEDAGDTEINFGEDIATYIVDAQNQGKVNVKYTLTHNEAIASKYPEANFDFVTFVKRPYFVRTGTLYIYAEPNTFLYEITAEGLMETKAQYDDNYGAWRLETRTLGAYAIADTQLDLTKKEEMLPIPDSSEEIPEEPKVNPGTGR